jgi:hypothetical protein
MKKITIIFCIIILILLVVGCIKVVEKGETKTISGENWDPYSHSAAKELCGFEKRFDDMIIKDKINNINGMQVRELNIKSSDYCIVNLKNQFNTVEIDGYDSTFATDIPLMPKSDMPNLDFPPDSDITKVEIIPQNEINLGKMNIPCTTAFPIMPGYKSEMIDCSDKFDIFPPQQYNYKIVEHGNEKSIILSYFPIKHNLKSKETILYTNFNIKIYYDNNQKIIVSRYSDIGTSKKQEGKQYVDFYLTNTVSEDLDLKIKIVILDRDCYLNECYNYNTKEGIIYLEEETTETVKSNEKKDITIYFDTISYEEYPYVYLQILDQYNNILFSDSAYSH